MTPCKPYTVSALDNVFSCSQMFAAMIITVAIQEVRGLLSNSEHTLREMSVTDAVY